MVILDDRARWHGGRMGAIAQRTPVIDEADGEPDHASHWLDDLGEHGGSLAIGRATPTREFRPGMPVEDMEEASGELVEA